MDGDLKAVLDELEKLNRAHGGTVMAHSKALYGIRNDLRRMERRLYRIEQGLLYSRQGRGSS